MEFLFKPPVLLIIIALYLPIVLRSVLFFLHDGIWGVRFLNRQAGRLELFFGWMRDWAMIPVSLYVVWSHLYSWAQVQSAFPVGYEAIFLGLAVYSRWWRWHGLKPLQEFARLNPRVHPEEFFEHLYGRLGFLPHRVPLKAKRLIDPNHLQFRKNKKPQQSYLIVLHGIYDTYLFATLAYKAFRWKGAHYIRRAGSGLSVIWAARLAQLSRMEVVLEKDPKLSAAGKGKHIYAINHKSFFDFCVAPLVYFKEEEDGSAANFMPRIMVAKDHFKDNLFLYRAIGFGKMLEAWGMIFVDRKSKKLQAARRAVGDAVKKLIASDMSFSIYPQGTRAYGQLNRDGTRWDSAYFCVGKKDRLKKEGGHFKKGVAYVAIETALSLLRHNLQGPVWIFPVGMSGVGSACPKKSWNVQTETKISIKMGEPIKIDPQELLEFKKMSYQEMDASLQYREKVAQVVGGVDHSLQNLLGVAPRLERRFFTDLNEILDSRGVDEVAVAFKEWRTEGELVYAILDYVYCLPMNMWRQLLSEFAHLLRQQCSRDQLVVLKNKIAESF